MHRACVGNGGKRCEVMLQTLDCPVATCLETGSGLVARSGSEAGGNRGQPATHRIGAADATAAAPACTDVPGARNNSSRDACSMILPAYITSTS